MKKILFIIICIITLILSIIFFVSKKTEFSENENRYLATMPSLKIESIKSGDFVNELQDYITDNFPFRDAFVGLKTKVELLVGKKDINDIYIGKDGYMLTKYSSINTKKIIKTIRTFKDNNEDININLILLPSSISIYKEKLPKYAITDSETEVINQIYKSVDVKTIDVYDRLMDMKKDYNMFYKTDHHYTTYGAYGTYQEYCNNNNIDYFDQNFFKKTKVTSDFYGTLYSKTNNYDVSPDEMVLFKTNTDFSVKYMDKDIETKSLYDYKFLKEKDKYSVFLSNNHSLIQITNNNVSNNDELLVIKDSYGNSFVPFVAENYKKVHVVDLRYNLNSMSDYLSENHNIKDVIIIYNINTINKESSIYNLR